MNLYPHQQRALDWLTDGRDHALILDEQGLGKTITAIVAADQVDARSVLVIAPTVVTRNWVREFSRWSPVRQTCLLASGKDVIDMFADVVVVTHGLIRNERIRAQLLARRWDVCIVDEAHVFRNRSAKLTQVLYTAPDSIVSRCRRVWPMTGTPMPNNPAELWTHLRHLFPDRFISPKTGRPMSWWEFRARYCNLRPSAYGDGWKVVGAKNTEELRDRLAHVSIRRKERDVLDLPPMRYETLVVDGGKAVDGLAGAEDDVADRVTAMRDAGASAEEVLDTMSQAGELSTFRRLCGLAKVAPTVEMLDAELASDPERKVVVFAHHNDTVAQIAAGLDKFGAVTITGSTSAADRQRNVDRFQTDPRCRVAVCNIVAGGVGTTLTAARDLVFVEMSWVPGDNAQAAKRVHRIGQTGSVRVRMLALDGSVDELVTEVLANKLSMIRTVVG